MVVGFFFFSGMNRLVDAFDQNPTLDVMVAFTYTKTLRSFLEMAEEKLANRSKYQSEDFTLKNAMRLY